MANYIVCEVKNKKGELTKVYAFARKNARVLWTMPASTQVFCEFVKSKNGERQIKCESKAFALKALPLIDAFFIKVASDSKNSVMANESHNKDDKEDKAVVRKLSKKARAQLLTTERAQRDVVESKLKAEKLAENARVAKILLEKEKA